jgi:hypothetical protein
MVHYHYNPFQFATDVQAAENKVDVRHILKVNKKLARKDSKLAPSTMPRHDALMITGTPNAFIAPNPPDVMRMSKHVFNVY